MTTARRAKPRLHRALKVGDRVRFSLGNRNVAGIIIEDRGAIGAGGRRLYVVRARIDPSNESVLELPADELHAA